MESSSFESKATYQFASRNPAYKKLNSVYFDRRGFAFSTDGHRLFANRAMFNHDYLGMSVDVSALVEKKEYQVLNEPYPSLDALMPKDGYDFQFKLQVPPWFDLLEGYSDRVPMTVSYETQCEPKVVLGKSSAESGFGVDAKLLSVFAGKEVKILAKDSLSAIVIVPPETSIPEETQDLEEHLASVTWYAMVMPISIDLEINPKRSSYPNIFV